MYTLYDPDFTAEYTDQDEVVIYHKGKEVAQTIAKDLKTDRQLIDIAISLLNKLYTRKEYMSATEAADLLNVSRMSVHWIAENQLVLNYHYIMIGKKKYFTPKGFEVLEQRYKEKNGKE